ncbi:MAG: hypothetical protein R2800_06010 [Flavipsychrobacter sp.]
MRSRMLFRSVVLLGIFSCFITSLKAQVYFDSVYQDYIYVYKKVREFDMSFTEAMPITSSKTFILENEHVFRAIDQYRKKYPDYNELDLLVELSADVSVKFLKEQVSSLECKHNEQDYVLAYSNYICDCVEQKAKAMPGYKWAAAKDTVMKQCAVSFRENMDDKVLQQKMKMFSADEKVALQECAKVHSYINCETLTIDVIGTCINRAERYYYTEKGLRMEKEASVVNQYLKEGQLLPSELFLKGKELTEAYTLLSLEAKEYLELSDVLTYEVQDWDHIYSLWYREDKGEVKVLFGIDYQFGFNMGKAEMQDMSYRTVEEMNSSSLLQENIKRLLAAPIMGGSEE